MNDAPVHGLERPSRPPSPSEGAAGAGAMLRHAREAAGVHLASLALSLKVPVARLEALEAGRIDLLPDPVFARALAASMCRSLRIDPQPVLDKLPRTAATPTAAEPVTQTAVLQAASSRPAAKPTAAADRSRSPAISRSLGILIVLLLVATAVLIFVPDLGWQRFSGGSPDRPTAASASATGRVAADDDNAARTSTAARQPRPSGSTAAGAPATAAAPLPPIAAAPPPSAGSTAAIPPPGASTATAATPAAAGSAAVAGAAARTEPSTLLFETSAPAWIQVLDANGAALVRKTVPANERVRVSSADLPLRVTVGQADKTKVSVRGEPMDLAPVARAGVARFEVK